MSELSSWTLSALKIYDRFALVSEYIYGPLRRQRIQAEFELGYQPTEEMMERFIQDSLIIYCRPPAERIAINVRRTAQPKDIGPITSRVIVAYDEWFSHVPHKLFDYTSDKPEDLNDVIYQHRLGWEGT